MTRRQWPPAVKDRVREMRRKGRTLREIYDQTGVQPGTASNWCRDGRPLFSTTWPMETVHYCQALRHGGKSLREIEQLTGVPVSTQRGWYERD